MSGEEPPSTDIITLTRYVTQRTLWERAVLMRAVSSHVLSQQFSLGAVATGDLTLLLTAIQTTSKFIATNVRKARLINL